jgi:hypothetical protein
MITQACIACVAVVSATTVMCSHRWPRVLASRCRVHCGSFEAFLKTCFRRTCMRSSRLLRCQARQSRCGGANVRVHLSWLLPHATVVLPRGHAAACPRTHAVACARARAAACPYPCCCVCTYPCCAVPNQCCCLRACTCACAQASTGATSLASLSLLHRISGKGGLALSQSSERATHTQETIEGAPQWWSKATKKTRRVAEQSPQPAEAAASLLPSPHQCVLPCLVFGISANVAWACVCPRAGDRRDVSR